jgi:hypothetical protein
MLASDQEPVQEEEKHMAQFREGKGDEHDLSSQDVKNDHGPIVEPLMVCEIPCQKRCCRDQENQIVIRTGDRTDPGDKEAADQEESGTEKNDERQLVRGALRETPKANPPGLIKEEIMSQNEKWRHNQTEVENRRHDHDEGMGVPNGLFEREGPLGDSIGNSLFGGGLGLERRREDDRILPLGEAKELEDLVNQAYGKNQKGDPDQGSPYHIIHAFSFAPGDDRIVTNNLREW